MDTAAIWALSNLAGMLGMTATKRLFGWVTKRFLPQAAKLLHFDPQHYSIQVGHEIRWLPHVINDTGVALEIVDLDVDLRRGGRTWETSRTIDGTNSTISRKSKSQSVNRSVTFRPGIGFWSAGGDAVISGEVVFDTIFGKITKSFNRPSGTHVIIREEELDD